MIDVIGIDLGTSYSVMAIWDPEANQTRVLYNAENDILTPSVVRFDPQRTEATVGKAASAQLVHHPDQVIYSVKRFIGCTFQDKWVQHDQNYVTYSLEETQQHKIVIKAGERMLTPAQVSAEVLRKLKNDAENALGEQKITKAIITVPAYFNDSQREATKEAGKRAGLDVQQLVSEPTAAALAFGLGLEPQTIAVFDLGGGTFDISIVQIKRGGLFRVIATKGDTHLGGDDFDQAIVQWMKGEFEREQGKKLPIADNSHLRARLREEAERAKIALSKQMEYVIDIPRFFEEGDQSFDLHLTLTRAKMQELIRPLINRTLSICDSVLEDAGLHAEKIDQALLVGGQTRTPMVGEALRAHFKWALNDAVNPDEAVARGAAVLGARYCGFLKDRVKLMDVIPLSIGVETSDGKMEVLISANKTVPTASKTKVFTTSEDRQERIHFRIYQGERPRAENNVLIGELIFPLATVRPKGAHQILCTFKVDRDGTLQVYAKDVETEGEPVKKTFNHEYQISQEEIEDQIKEANLHKQEDAKISRLFDLEQELVRVSREIAIERSKEDLLFEYIHEMNQYIEAHNLVKAEELLAKIKASM